MRFFGGGKKKVIKADREAPILDRLSRNGLEDAEVEYGRLQNSYRGQSSQDQAQNQINVENRLMRQATDDAAMRTKGLLAQRGLQNSSVGLGVENRANYDLSNRVAMNNAGLMDRTRDVIQNRMNSGFDMANRKVQLGGNPINMRTTSMRGKNGFGQLMDTAQGAANIVSASSPLWKSDDKKEK